jgi:hypothetical protein
MWAHVARARAPQSQVFSCVLGGMLFEQLYCNMEESMLIHVSRSTMYMPLCYLHIMHRAYYRFHINKL